MGHGPAAEAAAAGRLSGRIVSPPPESGLQPPRRAPEEAAPPWDSEGPGADAPERRETGGGAGGTSFAAWDGAFGCIRRSFPLCGDTDTRFHLLLRSGYRGGPGVAAARSPLWVQVLKAAARRLRLALLLWWQEG